MKLTKWKKRNRKFSNNKFSFKMRQKNLSKSAKMFEISQTWFAAWTRVRINYSRKSESVSFSHKFCSYFIGCGFADRAKSWIQLRTNMYITIFVFLSPGNCFEPAICIQTSLEMAPIALFSSRLREGKIIHKKSLRLRSLWSFILRPPKHRLMFFLSILSAKEVICPFLEWKQDPGSL